MKASFLSRQKAEPSPAFVKRSMLALKGSSAVRFDGLDRTYFNACAAVRAFIRIDDVNRIALADGLDRAFRNAGTAGDAFFIDFMSHANLHMMCGKPKIRGKFSENIGESQPFRMKTGSDKRVLRSNPPGIHCG
jgi:hypothetical protein